MCAWPAYCASLPFSRLFIPPPLPVLPPRRVLSVSYQELDNDQPAGGENEPGGNEAVGGGEGGDCKENEDDRVLYRIPESRIRKIISGRQAAAKRWRKVQTTAGTPGNFVLVWSCCCC